MNKEVIKTVIQIAVSILTSILTIIGGAAAGLINAVWVW